jgi:hypothetical protein
MPLLKYFFWFWFKAPQVGEQWTFMDLVNDPWNTYHLTVTERRGNWYRLRTGSGHQESKHRATLVSFYVKTGEASDHDGIPF